MPRKEKSQLPPDNSRKPASRSFGKPAVNPPVLSTAATTGSAVRKLSKSTWSNYPAPPLRQLPAAYAVISRRAAERLRAGHVWVYRSDIYKVEPGGAPSRLLSVLDPRGRVLGAALYSDSSEITLRLVSTGALDPAAWPEIFRERLRTAIRSRRSMLDSATDACRLVFSEGDFLPGLIVDKYGDLSIFQVLTQGTDDHSLRTILGEVLVEELSPRAIYERSDARIREIERLGSAADGPLYADPAVSDRSAATIFNMNCLRFHYQAAEGQKTGAFLDQRENYSAAERHCHGDALDVCTYQGGFALHLARRCPRVTGVDVSRPALEVAERNLALNRDVLVDAHVEWIEANAFDLLREWSDAGRKFDSIVLDPPAFAKSKRAAEGAVRGYKELNLRVLKMLRPAGTLITCSCSHHVGVEEFTAIVASAASDARRNARLLERRGAASDHPVLLGVSETEYLKCIILRVV
jgi:23S rRNA (cytosine1962-C5)-methyltransferase